MKMMMHEPPTRSHNSFPRSAWECSLRRSASSSLLDLSRGTIMGRSRYKFGEAPYPQFLTCTVVGWLPVFTRPETVQILLDSWQFLQDQDRLVLLGYVVLDNHIHFIA